MKHKRHLRFQTFGIKSFIRNDSKDVKPIDHFHIFINEMA